MELSILLIRQIIQLFIIVFCGYLVVKFGILKSEDSKVLSLLILYVVTPATLIDSFAIELTSDVLEGLAISFIGAIVVHIIYIPLANILARKFHFDLIEKASLIYSNSGNLIIPLVSSVLGSEWVIYTCGYMVIQTILLWTHCKTMISGDKELSFKKIFLNVGIISITIGMIILFFQIPLPELFLDTCGQLNNLMGPCAMLIVGMLLGSQNVRSIFLNVRIYLVCFFRLIIFPLCVVVVFMLAGKLFALSSFYTEVLLITTMACCAPAATMVTQFAQMYDMRQGYASRINILSVLLCIITMPTIIFIYQLLI